MTILYCYHAELFIYFFLFVAEMSFHINQGAGTGLFLSMLWAPHMKFHSSSIMLWCGQRSQRAENKTPIICMPWYHSREVRRRVFVVNWPYNYNRSPVILFSSVTVQKQTWMAAVHFILIKAWHSLVHSHKSFSQIVKAGKLPTLQRGN